jgi:hypothetical protein
MRKYGLILLLFAIAACKTSQQNWQNDLVTYKEIKDKTMELEVMRAPGNDTTVLNYKIRIFPAKAWLENMPPNSGFNFSYKMDSCFFIRAGNLKQLPLFTQPVANGVKNCFEYLVSFQADAGIKMRSLQLIYADKYINGQTYSFELNKQ